jgi:D-alanyl-D-alanine carboxypeptidase/D-alanyl-D-alanine-endopeptidase (penicillin-binding protein 4)
MRLPRLILTIAALAAAPAFAQTVPPTPAPTLEQRVAQSLSAAPAGTRWGLLVVTADGRRVVAVNQDERFIPASNTKLFTTAAAYALLPGMNDPDAAGGAGVVLENARGGAANVVLIGHGDARMSSAADCVSDCLAALADSVAAKTRRVGDIIGDDRWFPDERFSPGMSWNNIGSDSGTATSALSLDSNELVLKVTPGAVGQPPLVAVAPYVTLINEAVTVTVAEGVTTLRLEHRLNSQEFRLYGQIPIGGTWRELLGIDDPAHYAAWALKAMLEARGVRVKGNVQVRHRPLGLQDDPAQRGGAAYVSPPEPAMLARLIPPPLSGDVTIINKVSQNLHAELMLRRLGRLTGSGSLADGIAALRGVLERAGVPQAGYDFSDGSGMSSYNRVSPRAAVALIRWAIAQPWGADWQASLPIGGMDGTLRRRFAGTPLQGNIFAKTGTLNATNALSGTMRAASGRELIFSIFANDVPDAANAVPVMDAALALIAAAN